MLELVRFARTCAPLAYIPEFEAGIWHGWHARIGILGADQYRLIGLSALLAGAAGWGWYMLVNRDNWYMSPIDELGRARPDLAAEFSALVRVFRTMDPPGLEKVTSTAVAMDVLQLAASVGESPGEAVLEALYQADVDYECFDVDTGHIEKPLLFYAGMDWLGEAAQRRLLEYVERGGTLVLLQTVPLRDERMRPLSVLGLQPPAGVTTGGPLLVTLGTEQVTCHSEYLGWYTDTPGDRIVAEQQALAPRTQQGSDRHLELPAGERYVVGYREQRGRGSIVSLGVDPSPELVLAIYRWLDVPVACRAEVPHVSTALFQSESGTRYLVVVNTADEDRECRIELDCPCQQATDLFSGTTAPADTAVLVRLQRKAGTVMRLD
jgi:hypothetical protein